MYSALFLAFILSFLLSVDVLVRIIFCSRYPFSLQASQNKLLFCSGDGLDPSPRGAWLLPEVHSYILLAWAMVCAGLTFCVSSHMLRLVLWIIYSGFFLLSFLRSRSFVPEPRSLVLKLTPRGFHVLLSDQKFKNGA